MRHLTQSEVFFRARKSRRERVLRKMSAMRAAKKRKQILRGPREEIQRPIRWHRFEFGVRDKLTGAVEFVDLKSVRHASKALGLILKFG